MLSFGVYLSLTFDWLSLRAVLVIVGGFGHGVGLCLLLLGFSLLHVLLHLSTQLLTVELYIMILEVTLTCILMQG